MILGIDPKIDYAFKRLFGMERNRDLLIDLINAVLDLPPGEQVAEVEILNPFNPQESSSDKLSIVDIKARDQQGRHFNVEMQMAAEAVVLLGPHLPTTAGKRRGLQLVTADL